MYIPVHPLGASTTRRLIQTWVGDDVGATVGASEGDVVGGDVVGVAVGGSVAMHLLPLSLNALPLHEAHKCSPFLGHALPFLGLPFWQMQSGGRLQPPDLHDILGTSTVAPR